MAKVDLSAPVDESVLPLEEQLRVLESDRRAHAQGIERQRLEYQRAAQMEPPDTARMSSAQHAADNDARQIEILEKQIADVKGRISASKSRKARG